MNYEFRPLYVMLKPAGAHCNLACRYCYYLDKAKLYPDEPRHVMSDELLEHFTREYILSQAKPEVLFPWHGGETLMRPISFYEKAMHYQRKYAGGRRIENCIQTNGTLLTPQWCEFFRDNHWLVGVSIDGPQEFHDEYRRSRGGGPSWAKVMKGIDLLNKYHVEWNAMAVVNDYNADYPLDFYHFFKEIGCRYIQFTPIVERDLTTAEKPLLPFSVTPEQWGNFLCTIFDEWVRHDVGTTFVQLFDSTLANWCGMEPGVCTMGRDCGHAAVMEFNGDVYACDHFVSPEYLLGNIHDQSLVNLLYGERQEAFRRLKHDALPAQCHQCEWEFACHGECPKNRFCTTSTGEPGLNYLCAGYHRFFRHVAPYMDFMKQELQAQRSPANVMTAAIRTSD